VRVQKVFFGNCVCLCAGEFAAGAKSGRPCLVACKFHFQRVRGGAEKERLRPSRIAARPVFATERFSEKCISLGARNRSRYVLKAPHTPQSARHKPQKCGAPNPFHIQWATKYTPAALLV
jgi:hypothetical protein